MVAVGHITLLALLVLVSAAPVALGQGDAPTALLEVTDPEGDATEINGGTAAATAANACWAASPATPAACQAVGNEAEPVPTVSRETEGVGTPAPPDVDILRLDLLETPTSLEIVLELARLDMAAIMDMERQPIWDVEWSAADEGCGEAVWMVVLADGTPRAGLEHWDASCLFEDPAEHAWGGRCNDWGWCTERVDVEIVQGSPGRIMWTVPRASLIHAEQGDDLHDVVARASLGSRYTDTTLRWFVPVMDPVAAGGAVFTGVSGAADLSEATGPASFAQPHVPAPPSGAATEREEFPEGTGWNDQVREDLDVVALELVETPTTVTVRAEMALVDVQPAEDIYLWFALALPTGHVIEAVAGGYEGEWVSRAIMRAPSYGQPLQQYTMVLPTTVELEPGRPGAVGIVFDRTELPFIEAGGRTSLFVLSTLAVDERNRVNQPVGPTKLWARLDSSAATTTGDYTHGSRPYTFVYDSPVQPAVLAGSLHVDGAGDAQLTPTARLGGGTPDTFDITYLEVKPHKGDASRFTMGVRDLSVRIPTGYHAVFYAFGVETPTGPYMVGYYKVADESAGTFLCAADTTVFADEPGDPTSTVWTVIDGLLASASSGGFGGGGPGSITWTVPHECLGGKAGHALDVSEVTASSFLVRNPAGRSGDGALERVDEASFPGPMTLLSEELALASLPAPASNPLLDGDSWFWWGIRLAGLVGGPAMFVAARRAKRRNAKAEEHAIYRAAIEQTLRAGNEPDKDADVLVGLRKRFGISDRAHAIIVAQAREGMGRTPSTLAPGTVFLERYRVEEVLGQGGFGFTYLAHDETLDRKVVLKASRWESEKEQKRALDEAKLLARLGHPNIVTVLDAERVGDEVVMVLEHVAGGSLADRLERGPLTSRPLERLAHDVMAGLEAAHDAGIVHRDVKPGNILLTSSGTAKLADFGIARADGTGTVTGATFGDDAAGTVAYMAPEQARGQPPDARADLYAVGAVLYEAATGRTYIDFEGMAEFEARLAILDAEPRLPVEALSPGLNDVLASCLAKDPGLRPQDVAELRRMWADVRADGPRVEGTVAR